LAKCWDVVFLEFQNDGTSFLESTFYDVNGYINTAWLSSCGFVPDIIWITGPGQSTTAYPVAIQESNLFQQDFIRSAVMAGNTMPPSVSLAKLLVYLISGAGFLRQQRDTAFSTRQ
jgi:hypothetical protein